MDHRITRRRALTGLAALGSAAILPRAFAAAEAAEPQLAFDLRFGFAVPKVARDMFTLAADALAPLLRSRVPVRLEVEWGTGSPGVRMVYAFQDSPKPGVYHSSALANRFVGQRVDLNLPDARIVFPAFEHDPVRWNFTPAGPPPSPRMTAAHNSRPAARARRASRTKARAAARRPPANELTPDNGQRTTT